MTKKKKDYTLWIIVGAIAILGILMFSCTPRANGGNTFLIVQNPQNQQNQQTPTTQQSATTTQIGATTTTTSSGGFDWFGLFPTTTIPHFEPLVPVLILPDSPTCSDSDSDAARQISVFGQCLDGGAAYKSDVCVDDRTVREYRCEDNCVYSDVACPDGFNCISGACKRVSCTELINARDADDCIAAYSCRDDDPCVFFAVPFYERGGNYCGCVSYELR